MIKNADPKKNPVTTIVGIVLFVIGLGTILMPLWAQPRQDLAEWTKYLFLAAGFGLILAPDKILYVFSKVIDKKSDTL